MCNIKKVTCEVATEFLCKGFEFEHAMFAIDYACVDLISPGGISDSPDYNYQEQEIEGAIKSLEELKKQINQEDFDSLDLQKISQDVIDMSDPLADSDLLDRSKLQNNSEIELKKELFEITTKAIDFSLRIYHVMLILNQKHVLTITEINNVAASFIDRLEIVEDYNEANNYRCNMVSEDVLNFIENRIKKDAVKAQDDINWIRKKTGINGKIQIDAQSIIETHLKIINETLNPLIQEYEKLDNEYRRK